MLQYASYEPSQRSGLCEERVLLVLGDVLQFENVLEGSASP